MFDERFWEIASYVVTVFGLPLAIAVFLHEQRRERANEEAEAYQTLADAYNEFLRVVIDNTDLHLRTPHATPDLSPEQRERMLVIFDMLVSLLERAYLTAWSPRMTAKQQRQWNVWEDFMREWVRRDDFYARLEDLLRGEDPEFAAYFRKIAAEERAAVQAAERFGHA